MNINLILEDTFIVCIMLTNINDFILKQNMFDILQKSIDLGTYLLEYYLIIDILRDFYISLNNRI